MVDTSELVLQQPNWRTCDTIALVMQSEVHGASVVVVVVVVVMVVVVVVGGAGVSIMVLPVWLLTGIKML